VAGGEREEKSKEGVSKTTRSVNVQIKKGIETVQPDETGRRRKTGGREINWGLQEGLGRTRKGVEEKEEAKKKEAATSEGEKKVGPCRSPI